MNFSTLLVDYNPDGIVVCRFNRPEVRNALNRKMVTEIRAFLRDLSQNPQAQVLIFTGEGGKAFISGADISELKERTKSDALCQINSRLFREIEEFHLPTIAAISGYALGGGCELAMACDLRIGGESARLGQPEVGLGIIPAAGGLFRLAQLIGMGKAKELALTGRMVEAKEALQMGLLNQVVRDNQVLDAAKTLAKEILKNGPMAVRMAKRALNAFFPIPVQFGMGLESAIQGVLFESEEKHQRMQGFLDRKKKS